MQNSYHPFLISLLRTSNKYDAADGHLCGKALVELFENAKDPNSIVVSLVEQQHEDDLYCMEVYCQATAGANVIDRMEVSGGKNIVSNSAEKAKCPRIDQIRVVRIQDDFSKGPPWSRALGRRSLGNEEFCLQTAADISFAEGWDEKVRNEWLSADNEFGIISNPPKPKNETESGDVPRTCRLNFLDEEKLPHYDPNPDGKVERLKRPLLAHTWSPGFSFSKCHLEEAAPADGFLPYVSSDIEAFARYARFWTRGYDVYTPTQNIVYRQAEAQQEHKLEWINAKNWGGLKTTVRSESLNRIRSYLEIEDESVTENLDNLGNYGIGNRRTLRQLTDFVGINLKTQQSRSDSAPCGNFRWVPYDSDISPMENLYSNPNDLDPQPEYPMRTEMTFISDYEGNLDTMGEDLNTLSTDYAAGISSYSQSDGIPYGTLFILWILGVGFWCNVYVFSKPQRRRRKKKKGRNSSKNK